MDTEGALALVPAEVLAAYFLEQPESPSERAKRLALEALRNPMERMLPPPPKRFRLAARAREGTTFRVEDTTGSVPEAGDGDSPEAAEGDRPAEGKFDLILCRYSIFLYGDDENARRRALARICSLMQPDGLLLLGTTDALPQGAADVLEPVPPELVWQVADDDGEKPIPACAAAAAGQRMATQAHADGRGAATYVGQVPFVVGGGVGGEPRRGAAGSGDAHSVSPRARAALGVCGGGAQRADGVDEQEFVRHPPRKGAQVRGFAHRPIGGLCARARVAT